MGDQTGIQQFQRWRRSAPETAVQYRRFCINIVPTLNAWRCTEHAQRPAVGQGTPRRCQSIPAPTTPKRRPPTSTFTGAAFLCVDWLRPRRICHQRPEIHAQNAVAVSCRAACSTLRRSIRAARVTSSRSDSRTVGFQLRQQNRDLPPVCLSPTSAFRNST